MKYENYNAVNIADDLSSFDFMSSGKNGDIRKRIIFMPTHLPEVYVLAFGSITDNDEVDDFQLAIMATEIGSSRLLQPQLIYIPGGTLIV